MRDKRRTHDQPEPRDEAALHEPSHRDVRDQGDPHDEARKDAERILQRNRKLIEGEAEPGPEGEREVGTGRTVTDGPQHSGAARGDYSND
jgi:hypothetical protein